MQYLVILVVVVVAALGAGQFLFAKKGKAWMGLIVPAICLVAVAGKAVALLDVTGPRYQPDYYGAAALLFPAVWCAMMYFTGYYYYKSKN